MRLARLPAALLALLALAALVPFARAATPEPHDAPPGEDDGEGEDNPYATPSASAAPSARAPSAPRVTVIERGGMLLLPGGRFTMGSWDHASPPNERPPHAVTVGSFWIDKTETTVAAYRECVDRRACARPVKASAECTFDQDDPELPVSCVTWQEADTYCRFAGKRLLHESEWEFAARGTHPFRYPWGGWSTSCAFADTLLREATGKTCSKGHPSRVGAHPLGASMFGVLDLSGNVEEWTADYYADTYAGVAPRSGASHTLRGGGWLSAPSAARTTSRDWASSLEAGPNVGFRCAKDLD